MPTVDWQRVPLFVGGLMGPLGTGVILPMFPELREAFGVSSSAIGWGFTVYMLPFAALLVASGTLGERWGRRRTVRRTFLLYAAASMVCALAPNLGIFLLGRALQGIANAFITPLLLAGLADLTPPGRLGRTVGVYSSFQALGQGLAPVVGGIAADVDWRWAFVGSGIVALVLALGPPPGELRRDLAAPPVRPLFSRRMTLLGVGVFLAAVGPVGAAVLVGVAARDELNVSGTAAGGLLLTGSVAALVLGPYWGSLLDRWGGRRSAVTASLAISALVAALAFGSSPLSLGLIWGAAGAVIGFMVVVFQGLAAAAVPDNRGGALSSILAYRFAGHAVGPLVWLPVFAASPEWAFVGSAALGVAAALAVGASTRRGGPT